MVVQSDAIRRWWRVYWPVLVVGVLLVMPFITVGTWLYHNDRWAPIFDQAMTEVRVRDVGTVHTPLVGLPGRLGQPEIGSHPGPLSFYLLAPVYRLLGGSFWALRVSMMTLNGVAIFSALLIARRRAGAPAVLAVGSMIAFLDMGYGLYVLTEPWNPYLPVLWFVLFLVSVWAVICDDVFMLPVAAVSGSFCAQTHIPYFAVCGGLGALACLAVAVSWRRAYRLELEWRRYMHSSFAAAAVLVILWTPPVIDQCIHVPGNLSVLTRFFRHPPAAPLGFRMATTFVLAHLDARHLIVDQFREPGTLRTYMHALQPSSKRGAVVLVLWLISAFAAVKLRNRTLLAAHVVIAASLLVALIAISRITGVPWLYLMLWAWGIGAALMAAILATAMLGAWQKLSQRWRMRTAPPAAAALAMIGACALRLARETQNAGSSVAGSAEQLAVLAPPAAAAILRGVGASGGAEGRYLVSWSGILYTGQGLGLVNELERAGIHVGLSKEYGRLMTEQRVLDERRATGRIHLTAGASIDEWRRRPEARAIAFYDPRTTATHKEFDDLSAFVATALWAMGRGDLVPSLDRDLLAANIKGLNPFASLALGRMSEIGLPAAIFVEPIHHRRSDRPGAPR